jgi:hypothetical protein
LPSIAPINFSFLEKNEEKETTAVIDKGGSSGYTWAGKNGVGEKKQ